MTHARALELGGLLELMITILGSDLPVSFGLALKMALSEVPLQLTPKEEGALLAVAFRIMANKGIPGAPDA